MSILSNRSALWLSALAVLCGSATAQTLSRPLAGSAKARAVTTADTAAPPSAFLKQTGTVQVALRLTDPPLIVALGENAKRTGGTMNLAQRQAYMAKLKAAQDAVLSQVKGLGGAELGRVGKSYNALMVAVDASRLPQVAAIAGVSAIKPIVNSQQYLGTTVPYIGAAALQAAGLNGTGVKIAILDSGIDYTHADLGGSGSLADFAAASGANATSIPDGLFPTSKVIGGYDFVGETWPNTALKPDKNPIDAGTGSSHGTHVAAIAGGLKGVAPGAKLYAVKVCSSVATSCSGVAILQGLDWVVDPNGDLNFDDAADVVNLSLGSNYGQRENPDTEAVSNLVRFGIVVAAAAGNAADRPYIVSSPSNAPEAISVAQTAMPLDAAIPLVITSPASIAGTYGNTATVDWAPIGAGVAGRVVRAGRGCPAGSVTGVAAADPLPDLTDAVALIDRGSCSVSLKVDYAVRAGAKGVLIGLVAAGDAVSFSNGGGSKFAPTLVIQQSLASAIKRQLSAGQTVNVSVSATNPIALAGSMAGTSARGPGFNGSPIKPEIGAPGASVSAVNGTGTESAGFGGTSGATPMIVGSAALLLQKFPTATPSEIKSRLMNSANSTVYTNNAVQPGVLAPISRIGAGEVRVDRAAALTTGLWDASNPYNVGLSFGTVRMAANTTYLKKVAVRNYSGAARTYTLAKSFRYANDEANGAVSLTLPASVSVPANSTAVVLVRMDINAAKLPEWGLDSGGSGGNGPLLQTVEYDGYITATSNGESVSVPWHVLPHKAANVITDTSVALGGAASGGLNVANLGGATSGYTDIYALTGTSPKSSQPAPAYGGGQVLVDLKAAGVRGYSDGGAPFYEFAIATYGERAHAAYPAEYDVYLDTNNDGVWDYVMYNTELSGFGLTGQTVVALQKLKADGKPDGSAQVLYFADVDLNSGNIIFPMDGPSIGVASLDQKINFMVLAFDNYFTGDLMDSIGPMGFTASAPKYDTPDGNVLSLPVGAAGAVSVSKSAAGAAASPSQSGFLLLHRNARSGRESDVVTVTP